MKMENGFRFRKVLTQRGFSGVDEVVAEVRKPTSKRLKKISYCRLVKDLCEEGLIDKHECRYLRASHTVRIDFPYISPLTMESTRAAGSKVIDSFMKWLDSMGVDHSYAPVALLYELGKLQESAMYCIEKGKCSEEGNFMNRLMGLCSYLLYMKESNPKRYKMVGYIFTGISEKQISHYSGMSPDEIQPYLKGIAKEIGGVVQVYEAKENIDKCKFPLPKVSLESLGFSIPVLYRLGELEITSSEELYLLYRLGVLENRWLLRPEWCHEVLFKMRSCELEMLRDVRSI